MTWIYGRVWKRVLIFSEVKITLIFTLIHKIEYHYKIHFKMTELSYEEAAKELDAILAELKDDKISIDKLAEKNERAAVVASFCSQILNQPKQK